MITSTPTDTLFPGNHDFFFLLILGSSGRFDYQMWDVYRSDSSVCLVAHSGNIMQYLLRATFVYI